jgi:hypothetical protein
MSQNMRGLLFAIGILALTLIVGWTAHSAWTTNIKTAAAAAANAIPSSGANGAYGPPKEVVSNSEAPPDNTDTQLDVAARAADQIPAANSLPDNQVGPVGSGKGGAAGDGDAADVEKKRSGLFKRHSSKIIGSFKGLVRSPDDTPEAVAACPFELLKILVRFLQYLLIIFSAGAPWPSSWRVTATSLSVVFSSHASALGLDCILPASPAAATVLPVAARSAITQEALPLALFLAMGLMLALDFALRAKFPAGIIRGRRGRTLSVLRMQQRQSLGEYLKARLPTLALVRFGV